ncbi:hypothetical protein [Streptomyces sp. NPDC095613]|uniref:hypothetical protein n=1 Tax=Streptomyces sp. NPDC095613 TaxID=3155540 RepID=UPI00332F0752
MLNLKDEPVGYIVVAETLLGPTADPLFGKYLHHAADCAAFELRDMAVDIARDGCGTAFLVDVGGEPTALVVTSNGQLWGVRARSPRELRVEL